MPMQLHVDIHDPILQDAQRTWALVNMWAAANADGLVAGPISQLADRWGCSPRTVQRLLRELEAGDWVRRLDSGGYQLTGRGMAAGRTDLSPLTDLSSSVVSPEPSTKTRKRAASETSSEASRLLHQHADRYTQRFNQPFPVAWARDTQIYKRLVKVYGVETLEALQSQYLDQPLDSFAAKRGFSVTQFSAEIAGLAAQQAVRDQLTTEQSAVVEELTGIGMGEVAAVALVTDYSLEVIRDQLLVHYWRKNQGQSVGPGRLERAVREGWAVPAAARPVSYPAFPVSEAPVRSESAIRSEALDDWLAQAVVKA